ERSLRHSTVPLLPRAQVVEREGMVGILRKIQRVVEYDQRQDHLLQRDLIHGDTGLGKMRRRVDMGSVLADHLIVGRVEAVLGNRVWNLGRRGDGRRHLRLAEAGPDRRFRTEAVGEIDKFLSPTHPIGVYKTTRSIYRGRKNEIRGDGRHNNESKTAM